MEDRKLLNMTDFSGNEIQVALDVSMYQSNHRIYLGLEEKVNDQFGENLEPYGSLTVNINEKFVPDFCAYLDTNNMPGAEKFITDNGIGEFTGLVGRSGYCEYPLYMFYEEKLRELCPEGVKFYESNKDRPLAMAR